MFGFLSARESQFWLIATRYAQKFAFDVKGGENTLVSDDGSPTPLGLFAKITALNGNI